MGKEETPNFQTEDALQQSEAKYRRLFNSIDEAFCIVEVLFDESGKAYDYRFLEVNPAFEKTTGLKDAPGKTATELVPNLEDHWAERYGQIIKDQQPARFTDSSDAMGRWFDLYAFPIGESEKNQVAILFNNITDRKNTESEIKALNTLNREILESITDAFFAIDRDWRFTYVNPQAEKVLDRQPGDLIGKVIWEEFPGIPGSEFEQAYRRTVEERIPSTFTAYYPDHDRWYEVHAYPAANGVTIYFRNVTEHRRRDNALLKSQEETERQRRLYDTVLSNTPDLVYIFNLDHRFIYANKILLEMWGKTEAEALGKNCLELGYEPWHAAMHDREIEEVIATKAPIRGDVPFNGTFGRRMYDYIFSPIFNESGEVEAIAGTTRDVTERHQMENRNRFILDIDEAVRPLETPEEITHTLARLLGEYLDADRCDYAEVEPDEDHFYVAGDYTKGDTPSIVGRYRMADFGAEVLRRMRVNKLYVVDDVDHDPQITAEDLAAYRQMGIQAVICVPLHKNGRYAACMAVHQRTSRRWTPEEIELVGYVANRFWEAIERARVLKSLNESLVREQEARQTAETVNRVKDEFLATLSHELRTPLNAILGWATMLRNGRLNEADAARALETVERSARAQSQLIEDLLDISRIITGKLRLEITELDLSEVIAAATDAVRPAAEAKGIRLQVLLDSEAGLVSGDANRLQQVVWNLVSNAVKFTPKEGRVQIRLERINSHVEITVSDTGKGIDPDFLPHVFDRFRQADQTTTRRQGGLGLGLSIVRQLVEMHGGTVHAESEGDGTGTSFIVKLPRLIAHTRPGKEKEPRIHPTAGSSALHFEAAPELANLRMLVVDDETDSRELLRAVLEQCGAKVTTTSSAAEALEKLESATFDGLISDIGMPDEDGYTLIGKVRQLPSDKNGRLPAIALTAYARVEDRVRALNAGFQAHIPKPVEPIELVAVVVSLAKGLGKD